MPTNSVGIGFILVLACTLLEVANDPTLVKNLF